jgi:hypothetical protein
MKIGDLLLENFQVESLDQSRSIVFFDPISNSSVEFLTFKNFQDRVRTIRKKPGYEHYGTKQSDWNFEVKNGVQTVSAVDSTATPQVKAQQKKIARASNVRAVEKKVRAKSAQQTSVDDSEDSEEFVGSNLPVAYGTKTAEKTGQRGSKFTGNARLINSEGDFLIVAGFYGFPMISDGNHQIQNALSGVDLLSKFIAAFGSSTTKNIMRDATQLDESFKSQYPVKVENSQDINQARFSFNDTKTMSRAVSVAERIVETGFKNNLVKNNNVNIHWINSDDAGSSTSFALSHWVLIPETLAVQNYTDLSKYAKQLKHYVFGYFENSIKVILPSEFTSAVRTRVQFKNFTIGEVEKLSQFYGFSAKSLRRISSLQPSRVLNMKPENLDVIDNTLSGRVLTQPSQQLNQIITTSYTNKPEKAKKLIKIKDQVLAAQFPVELNNISLKEVGFSTNAVAVDFMEVLHPIACMNEGGVINNGVMSAAQIFLGTTDLSQCKVFYPDSAIEGLFDSMLIGTNGKQLMISSKAGSGGTPAVVGLGKSYDRIVSNSKNIPPQLQREFKDSGRTEFNEILTLFNNIDRAESVEVRTAQGKYVKEQIISYKNLPREAKRKKIVANLAKYLNSLEEFTQYCAFVMSCTNLVQVNTEYGEKDRSMTVKGFIATWPNKIYDNIEFLESQEQLRFSMKIGANTDVDYNQFKGYDNNGVERTLPRYTMNKAFNSKEWKDTIDKLSKEYGKIKIRAQDNFDDMSILAKQNQLLKPLYLKAIKYTSKHGNDPGMITKGKIIPRDLLRNVFNILS